MNKTLKKANLLQEFGPLMALVVLVIGLSIASSDFASPSNFLSLLRQSSINGFIAFGMTLVILTGGIDLSVGSVLALSTVVGATLIKAGVPAIAALIAMLIVGGLLGLVSGVLVTKGRLQPFIATLITMTVYRGVTLIFTDGKPISGLGDSAVLYSVGKGVFLGIPIPVWLMVVTFLGFLFMLSKTVFGRRVYATGSSSKAAALAGVNIDKTKIWVYSISGFMAALSGVILLSRLGSAQPTLGVGYELDAIAAVALGGTSMNGGRGKIYGTIVGVLIIAVLNNGLNILGVSSYYQDVVKGLVILLAVLMDRKR